MHNAISAIESLSLGPGEYIGFLTGIRKALITGITSASMAGLQKVKK